MLKPYIERVDETGDHAHDKDLAISQPPEEIGSDSDLQDAEEVTDCEDLHTSASEEAGAKPDIAATVVLKDGDGAVDDSELIEVCPLTSMQSWEDVKVNDQLSKSQKVEVRKLLQEQSDVLTTLPGYTTLEEHLIITTTSDPIREKPYPLPYSQREVVEQEVREMLKMGIIRKSKSPYAAPPVLVKKPDGSVRFCVNYKKLNQVTVFDGEPMPCPEDV